MGVSHRVGVVDVEDQGEVERVGAGGQGFMQDAVAPDVFEGDAAQLVLVEVVRETGLVPRALMRETRTCRLAVFGQLARGIRARPTALATVRDLAGFLAAHQAKQDWALADVHDIKAFLATVPKSRKRRLTVLRQFFRFARTQKIILADPTRDLTATAPRGFTGQTLTLAQQRTLFRRWTTQSDAHPHEALLGILAPLHGASSSEVRHLQVSDVDAGGRTIRLGKRPHPVPLDPASWQVLQRCLAHRDGRHTANPHVIVTKGTKAGRAPASTAYMSHLLDPCGLPPRTLRCARLADLVNAIDPKIVAAAFAMNLEGVLIYLAD
jgi:integrase